MSPLTRKGYARIYCLKAEDVPVVREIIWELDPFEFEYMPRDLVAPFSEYPSLCYTHKFDALCMSRLTAICWSRGIIIWACDNHHQEYMADETKPSPENLATSEP